MKLHRALVTTWLPAIVLLHGCSVTGQRQHPDFDENRRLIEQVAVLPPKVEIKMITFTGENEELFEREADIAAKLDESARRILEDRGYAVCGTHFDKLAETDPDLAFQTEQLRTAFTEASKDLYTGQMVSAEDYKRFDVTVGPIVNRFSEVANADALLLMTFSGIVKSEGEMRKEIAASILLAALTGSYAHPASEAAAVEVALLDGNTGDVLWTNVNSATNLSPAVLRGALEKIPVREKPATPAEAAAPETPADTLEDN